jgi:hypothetical protein
VRLEAASSERRGDARTQLGAATGVHRQVILWVPETSSTSCDQVIFVDQTSDASLSSDAVLLKIDRFGKWLQRGNAVQ